MLNHNLLGTAPNQKEALLLDISSSIRSTNTANTPHCRATPRAYLAVNGGRRVGIKVPIHSRGCFSVRISLHSINTCHRNLHINHQKQKLPVSCRKARKTYINPAQKGMLEGGMCFRNEQLLELEQMKTRNIFHPARESTQLSSTFQKRNDGQDEQISQGSTAWGPQRILQPQDKNFCPYLSVTHSLVRAYERRCPNLLMCGRDCFKLMCTSRMTFASEII